MALNISDTGAIMAVYSSIMDSNFNWLLLHYVSESPDELGLHSYGKDGLDELKTKLSKTQVFIAFYREETDVDPGNIIINYIPPSVSSIRRARALVHSRRVGAIFKHHQTIYSVDNISLLTTEHIHKAIISSQRNSSPTTIHSTPSTPPDIPAAQSPAVQDYTTPAVLYSPLYSPSTPTLIPRSKDNSPKPIVTNMVRRSFTATYAPEMQPPATIPPVPQINKGGSLFTSLLRRKKKGSDESYEGMVIQTDLPPPTPPKDGSRYVSPPVHHSHSLPAHRAPHTAPLRHQRSRSLSEFAVISHVRASSEEAVIELESYRASPEPQKRPEYQTFTLRPSGKWAHDKPNDPEERARRRRELLLQREREEQQALAEEARRQRQLKEQKEEDERREREEEERRKVEIQLEIRRVTAERRLRERLEKEEDERKHRELEERKRADRERRLEEHRRAEEWRLAQARKGEMAARQAAEAKRQEEAERKRRIHQAAVQVTRATEDSELTGWITLQSADSLSWKRRYYRFMDNTIYLYRSPEDTSTVIDKVHLMGRVRALKECYEGYDFLEAIAFSFVVEFNDGRDNWSMFADSEEEKYRILGLFKIAGGLDA